MFREVVLDDGQCSHAYSQENNLIYNKEVVRSWNFYF